MPDGVLVWIIAQPIAWQSCQKTAVSTAQYSQRGLRRGGAVGSSGKPNPELACLRGAAVQPLEWQAPFAKGQIEDKAHASTSQVCSMADAGSL